MKKFLAVVLALVMTLAMGTAAFAYVEVAPGQIYVGPAAAEYLANPGDTIDLTIRYAGNPNETDNYPTDGYVIVPFSGTIGDPNLNTVNSVALTQDAVNAGVTLIGITGTTTEASKFYFEELEANPIECSMYTSFFTPEDGLLYGAFMMPADLVDADFNVLTINTTVSTDWVVTDYVAETPIGISFFAGEYAIDVAFFLSSEEAAAIADGTMMPEEATQNGNLYGLFEETNTVINAMPYQPTFEEALVEQLKGIGAALLDVLMIGINLLKGELEPADWFIPGEHDVVDLSFITDGIAMLVGMILGG